MRAKRVTTLVRLITGLLRDAVATSYSLLPAGCFLEQAASKPTADAVAPSRSLPPLDVQPRASGRNSTAPPRPRLHRGVIGDRWVSARLRQLRRRRDRVPRVRRIGIGARAHVDGCRGHYWAAKVARAVGTVRDWPAFEGKARLVALRWVDDLGGDPATKERRALWCWRWAQFEWERLRDPNAPIDYTKWPR